jgi:hypothetical protein
MHLFHILIPLADNHGRPFSKREFDRVKEELAAAFQGVTAYLQAPAEGLWKQEGQDTHDEIVVFEVMTESVDLLDWRNRRAELEQRFRQDRIIIRYMSMAIV